MLKAGAAGEKFTTRSAPACPTPSSRYSTARIPRPRTWKRSPAAMTTPTRRRRRRRLPARMRGESRRGAEGEGRGRGEGAEAAEEKAEAAAEAKAKAEAEPRSRPRPMRLPKQRRRRAAMPRPRRRRAKTPRPRRAKPGDCGRRGSEADAGADDTARPGEDESSRTTTTFVAPYVAPKPENYDARVKELDAATTPRRRSSRRATTTLRAAAMLKEHRTSSGSARARTAQMERHRTTAELAEKAGERHWLWEVNRFMRDVKKHEGIDYADSIRA
jgi:hypothetical protein